MCWRMALCTQNLIVGARRMEPQTSSPRCRFPFTVLSYLSSIFLMAPRSPTIRVFITRVRNLSYAQSFACMVSTSSVLGVLFRVFYQSFSIRGTYSAILIKYLSEILVKYSSTGLHSYKWMVWLRLFWFLTFR